MKSLTLLLTILILVIPLSDLNPQEIDIFPAREESEPRKNSKVTPQGFLSKIHTASNSGTMEKFLPSSNLTVSEFLDNSLTFTFNASILLINSSHWTIDGKYGKPVDFYGMPYPTSFQATVNRTSINHTYPAQNYYNWFGLEQQSFDYWINTTGFYEGYIYNSGGINMTVVANETLILPGIGVYDSWRIEGIDSVLGLVVTRYSSFGMFIDLNFTFTSNFYYNLTRVELSEIPPGYVGPSLDSLIPSNNSILPPGSLISPSFYSPYGIAIIYFQWDDLTNSSVLAPLPSMNGPHHLHIFILDNIGLSQSFNFTFTTDDSVPGIQLKNTFNESRISGYFKIRLRLLSSNGSFIYQWNGSSNVTLVENSSIPVENPGIEGPRILTISVVNVDEDFWIIRRFLFFIDNTPPEITIHDFVNGTTIKGTVNLTISLSEDGKLSYSVAPFNNDTFAVLKDENYTILIPNLPNGTFFLLLVGQDEANNTVQGTIIFNIYTSGFEWIWKLEANIPRRLAVVDSTGKPWFIFTLVSRVDQEFNLTKTIDETFPRQDTSHAFVVKFICSQPNELLFITLEFPLDSTGNVTTFPVHEWEVWDEESQKWAQLPTNYNEISHSWEATLDRSVIFFALRETGLTTQLRVITPGGGQISGFEAFISLIGLVFLAGPFTRKMVRKNKN
jgi:hypothetical protein